MPALRALAILLLATCATAQNGTDLYGDYQYLCEQYNATKAGAYRVAIDQTRFVTCLGSQAWSVNECPIASTFDEGTCIPYVSLCVESLWDDTYNTPHGNMYRTQCSNASLVYAMIGCTLFFPRCSHTTSQEWRCVHTHA